MSKAHKSYPALPVSVSYDLLNYMKNNLSVNSYTIKNAEGDKKALLIMTYRTSDGKLHQIFNTEISL